MNKRTALATAIAICAVLAMGAATALNHEATSDAYAGARSYFPEQFVNQAKEIEPMPQMYE